MRTDILDLVFLDLQGLETGLKGRLGLHLLQDPSRSGGSQVVGDLGTSFSPRGQGLLPPRPHFFGGEGITGLFEIKRVLVQSSQKRVGTGLLNPYRALFEPQR